MERFIASGPIQAKGTWSQGLGPDKALCLKLQSQVCRLPGDYEGLWARKRQENLVIWEWCQLKCEEWRARMGTLIWESISPNMVPVSRVVQRWFGGVRDTAFLTLDHKGRQTFLSSLHESIWEGPREALFGINRLNTASPPGLCFEKKKSKKRSWAQILYKEDAWGWTT